MKNDKVVVLKNPGVPGEVRDALTEVLRQGAQQLLSQAIETEVAEFLAKYRDARDDAGHRRMVRNGYLPARTIQTGIGEVPVKAPRVRDREGLIRFTSAIRPPYLRRSKTTEELLPWLYFKGISTEEFGEALTALLGRNAPGAFRRHGGPLKGPPGSRSMSAGSGARWRTVTTCICGSTASTSACGLKKLTSASSS